MRLSLCDILKYPSHYRDQLLQLWTEERDCRVLEWQRARALRQRRIQEAEAARAAAHPYREKLPPHHYEHITEERYYFGLPRGIRVILTTRGETDLFASPSRIALPEDHPLILEKQPKPEPELGPITIPAPPLEPHPPIPASVPTETEAQRLRKHASFKVECSMLEVRCSREATSSLPLSRAGPPSDPTSVTIGIERSIYHLRSPISAPSALPSSHDHPTKRGEPPIFDSTNLHWDHERPR